jgi:arsenate reductase
MTKAPSKAPSKTPSKAPYQVLFLCTGNSCRSILAEALLNDLGNELGNELGNDLENDLGNGGFKAYSAGSKPAGFVHPQALACLNHNHVPVHRPHSKSWDEFMATPLDLVVTVCANAAGESCPIFPGSPAKAHWGLPDPALATGSEAEIADVFQNVFAALQTHVQKFIAAVAATNATDIETIVRELGPPVMDD